MTLEKLYWRWRALATSLWEYAEEAQGVERLRREIPAGVAEDVMNMLGTAYHSCGKMSGIWETMEQGRHRAFQSYKCAPHRWERRRSAALYRLLRMQIRQTEI